MTLPTVELPTQLIVYYRHQPDTGELRPIVLQVEWVVEYDAFFMSSSSRLSRWSNRSSDIRKNLNRILGIGQYLFVPKVGELETVS